MLERAPGIYEVELYNNQGGISEIKIFLIPGRNGGRSLMVDAGFRLRECLESMEKVLDGFGIAYDELDIFLTHKHHDHCGLAGVYADRGARLFMNPQEDRHCYDCLYYSHSHCYEESQPGVLRSVGVSPELTPRVWEMFMELNRKAKEHKGWRFEIPDFSYTPVNGGEVLSYGGYHFQTLPLKGHTFGQMGLYEKDRRLAFCADQVINGIVPIVATTYPDEHLLQGYFDSLSFFKREFTDCLVLPAHNEPVADVKRVVDRIVFSYLDRADQIRHILEHGRHRMTTREVACLAYAMGPEPQDEEEFIKLKMVISKTFSCLEYLYDEDFVLRTKEAGIFYWEAPW